MSEQKLVSIVTPCYNGAKYLDRYADTLLNQDYHNCQLVFMDDGSTDDSGRIINSYKEKLKNHGIYLEYYRHDNVGLGGTVAKGIKHIKGDYLIWFDQDDLLDPHSISKRVAFLESHPEYGVVRTSFKKVHDEDLNTVIEIGPSKVSIEDRKKCDLFEDYLVCRNIWLQPGCFMIRMSAFNDVNPDHYLYPSREGHDWQLLLPVFYKYKCAYLDEPLFTYVLHEGSLSNAFLSESFERRLERMDNYCTLIIDTLQHMEITDYQKYKKMVVAYYLKQKFYSSLVYGKMEEARYFYKQLKQFEKQSFKNQLKYLSTYLPFVSKMMFK